MTGRPWSRFSALPRKVRFLLTGAFLAVLVLAGLAVYWQLGRTAWAAEPAVLRVLRGEVSASDGGENPETITDKTWIKAGGTLRAQAGALAVLQLYDGSSAIVKGPAEVHLVESKYLTKQGQASARSIILDVVQGEVTISAVGMTNARSSFRVDTPNSTGMIQGTVFQVTVSDSTRWDVSQGIVRVGGVVADKELNPVIALAPLRTGESLALPPLPAAWQADPNTAAKIQKLTVETVTRSVQSGTAVQPKGTTALVVDSESGIAVFRVEGIAPAESSPSSPALPEGFAEVDNAVLTDLVPSLVTAKTPEDWKPYVPAVPPPEEWVPPVPVVVHTGPPRYRSSIYGVTKPLGVAFDPLGQRLLVTEAEGERATLVFNTAGELLMTLVPPGTNYLERSPTYVAIDRSGAIYVSDRSRHVIDIFDVDGSYIGIFSPGGDPSVAWAPMGLTFDANGNLYVTEVTDGKHRVMVFGPSGDPLLEFGSEGSRQGEFSFPNGIAVDSKGKIYVADSNNFRIEVFSSDGQFISLFTGGAEVVGFPRGLAIEGDYLYQVDTFGHSINVFNISDTPNSAFSFGQRGVENDGFNYPNSLALDPARNIYIADRENNRVQIWAY